MNKLLYDTHLAIYTDQKNKDPFFFVETAGPVFDQIVKQGFSADDFDVATQFLVDYGIHLANLKKFHRAVAVLDKAASLFENNKKLAGKNLVQLPLYESTLLYRGVALYNVGKMKESSADLRRLTRAFPLNSKYKNWYAKSITRGLKQIQIIIFILLAIDILFYFKFKGTSSLFNSLTYSIMVGLIVCLLVTDFIKRKRKRTGF